MAYGDTLKSDDFNRSNSDSIGGDYTELNSSDFDIVSNKVEFQSSPSDAAVVRVDITPTSRNYSVECKVVWESSGTTPENSVGVMGRMSDAIAVYSPTGNAYYAGIDVDSDVRVPTGPGCVLVKVLNGAFTHEATPAWDIEYDTEYTLRLEMVSNRIRGYLDDVLYATIYDSDVTQVGKGAMTAGINTDGSHTFDDLLITDLTKITPFGSTNSSGDNTTDNEFTLPASWAVNDVAVFWWYTRDNTKTFTLDDSDITEKRQASSAGYGRLFIGYRRLQTGDTTFGWTSSSVANSTVAWGCSVFRGVTTSGDPFEAESGAPATFLNTNDPNPPAATGITDQFFAVTIFGKNNDYTSIAAPSGYTVLGSASSTAGSDASAGLAYREVADAGSENPGAWSLGGGLAGDDGYMWTGALKATGDEPVSLTVADGYVTTQADAPVLAVAKTLVVSDGYIVAQADAPALAQQSAVTVSDGATITQADALALIQQNTVIVQDAYSTTQADAPVLTQVNTLIVVDAHVVTQADGPTLTQSNTIVVVDGFVVTQADAPTLTQNKGLVVADAYITTQADSPAQTQQNTITVNDAYVATQADAPVLVQQNTLIVVDAHIVTQADSSVLIQANLIVVADGSIITQADNIDLGLLGSLVVQDAYSATQADSVTLTQASVLVVQDAYSATQGDNVDVNTSTALAVQDAYVITQADTPTLIVAHVLIVQDANAVIQSDEINLIINGLLDIQSGYVTTQADNVSLTQLSVLIVQDAYTITQGDLFALTQANTVVVANTYMITFADVVGLSIPGLSTLRAWTLRDRDTAWSLQDRDVDWTLRDRDTAWSVEER